MANKMSFQRAVGCYDDLVIRSSKYGTCLSRNCLSAVEQSLPTYSGASCSTIQNISIGLLLGLRWGILIEPLIL